MINTAGQEVEPSARTVRFALMDRGTHPVENDGGIVDITQTNSVDAWPLSGTLRCAAPRLRPRHASNCCTHSRALCSLRTGFHYLCKSQCALLWCGNPVSDGCASVCLDLHRFQYRSSCSVKKEMVKFMDWFFESATSDEICSRVCLSVPPALCALLHSMLGSERVSPRFAVLNVAASAEKLRSPARLRAVRISSGPWSTELS